MRTKNNLQSKWRDIDEEIIIKTEKPDVVEEIIICDSIEDLPKDEDFSFEQTGDRSDRTSTESPNSVESFQRKNFFRGLLPPKTSESYFSILENPVVRRCCIEHCYFLRNRRKRSANNVWDPLGQSEFENENSTEQQTMDFECLTTPDVNIASGYQNENIFEKERRLSSSSSSSSSSFDSSDIGADHSDDSEDNEPGRSGSVRRRERTFLKPRRYQLLPKRYSSPGTPNDFVSVNDIFAKIKKMKKLMKTDCEPEKFPKVKKTNRAKSVNYKSSEYLFPAPKIANGDKNWDDVQSLGLDDLLLKASELNAENFTKALGRKLDTPKGNFKESSEIVFTIPKPKKEVEKGIEDAQTEFPTRLNVKTVKLDISKPFLEEGKEKVGETAQTGEASPKKLGIKVKTVENINEEFKESVGLKNRVFEDARKERGLLEAPELFDQEESMKENLGKDLEENPFVMTIIQNKTEKQRPAILRNSYLKKKNVLEKPKPTEEGSHASEPQKLVEFSEITKSENLPKNITVNKGLGEIEKNQNFSFVVNSDSETPNACNKSQQPNKLVKPVEGTDKTLKMTSIEQKLVPEDTNRRFIKIVPYEPVSKSVKKQEQPKPTDSSPKDERGAYLSLAAFSSILKEILPEKWFLVLDKKFGLQIIKTQIDDLLNPSILISVVIARCGKLTVNVRGKQLKETHQLFSNLGKIRNSENKLSLNYVLGILNKLRCQSVCYGCDNPSLKKYWSGDGSVEHHSEFQQVYRSHLCQLLVSSGKKRCYPCYRMNECLKMRFKRDKLEEKAKEDPVAKESEVEELEQVPKVRGVKRNLEDFLEKSFSTMKQQISDEIEKNKKLDEEESALKAQEEVLSFMGLARKDSLPENNLRKSKRKKTSFYKLSPPVKKKIDQQELEFLEKHWADINTLFSTSLLFGAYSRTGSKRLQEKCRMFQKLLSTWREILKTNPDWIGRDISLSDEPDEDNAAKDSNPDQFETMDVPALRAYIINSVKEVNKIKHKLRTKNSYFKILYNKFVKRRMKRSKSVGGGNGSSTNTPTPTDLSSDESSRDKGKTTDEEVRQAACDAILTCEPDGD